MPRIVFHFSFFTIHFAFTRLLPVEMKNAK